ncbi:unnamed protein product [Ixodes persulcatus]
MVGLCVSPTFFRSTHFTPHNISPKRIGSKHQHDAMALHTRKPRTKSQRRSTSTSGNSTMFSSCTVPVFKLNLKAAALRAAAQQVTVFAVIAVVQNDDLRRRPLWTPGNDLNVRIVVVAFSGLRRRAGGSCGLPRG